MKLHRPSPRAIVLEAGQCLALQLPRGTELRVISGCVRLQPPPCWLAERVWWPPAHRCGEGAGLRIDDAGSWQCVAAQGATLLLQMPARRWRTWQWRWRAAGAATLQPAMPPSNSDACACSSCSG